MSRKVPSLKFSSSNNKIKESHFVAVVLAFTSWSIATLSSSIRPCISIKHVLCTFLQEHLWRSILLRHIFLSLRAALVSGMKLGYKPLRDAKYVEEDYITHRRGFEKFTMIRLVIINDLPHYQNNSEIDSYLKYALLHNFVYWTPRKLLFLCLSI